MTKTKQTAVDFLIKEIKNDQFVKSKNAKEWNEIFDKAKEMEKEQKREMFVCGGQYQLTGGGIFTQVHEELYECKQYI